MSTPPGQYDSLDALDAASAPAPADTGSAADNSAIITQQPALTFSPPGGLSAAMGAVYITLDDTLSFTFWNSSAPLPTITVTVRVLRPDGQVVTQLSSIRLSAAARIPQSFPFPQFEGLLLSIVVGPANTTIERGDCYVQVTLQRGQSNGPITVLNLLADYLSSGFMPSWPFGRVHSAVEGAGVVYTAISAVPGAGADVVLNQLTNTRWSVLSLYFTLTTSAAAGNRQVTVQLQSTGTIVYQVPFALTQGPGTTMSYSLGPGVPLLSTINGLQTAPLPVGVKIAGNAVIQTVSQGLDVGDIFGHLNALVEEWIDV